jgi:hypothetical protein
MSANGICEEVVFECQGVIRMRRGFTRESSVQYVEFIGS